MLLQQNKPFQLLFELPSCPSFVYFYFRITWLLEGKTTGRRESGNLSFTCCNQTIKHLTVFIPLFSSPKGKWTFVPTESKLCPHNYLTPKILSEAVWDQLEANTEIHQTRSALLLLPFLADFPPLRVLCHQGYTELHLCEILSLDYWQRLTTLLFFFFPNLQCFPDRK